MFNESETFPSNRIAYASIWRQSTVETARLYIIIIIGNICQSPFRVMLVAVAPAVTTSSVPLWLDRGRNARERDGANASPGAAAGTAANGGATSGARPVNMDRARLSPGPPWAPADAPGRRTRWACAPSRPGACAPRSPAPAPAPRTHIAQCKRAPPLTSSCPLSFLRFLFVRSKAFVSSWGRCCVFVSDVVSFADRIFVCFQKLAPIRMLILISYTTQDYIIVIWVSVIVVIRICDGIMQINFLICTEMGAEPPTQSSSGESDSNSDSDSDVSRIRNPFSAIQSIVNRQFIV